MQQVFDEKQAARLLALSVPTLRKRRLNKQPPIWLKIGRSVRYRAADLEAFTESCSAINKSSHNSQ